MVRETCGLEEPGMGEERGGEKGEETPNKVQSVVEGSQDTSWGESKTNDGNRGGEG